MSKKYTFEGWRTVVVKQHFEIEANSQEEANAKILELHNNYELEGQWFDYDTNSMNEVESPDFYDEDDNLVVENLTK